MDRKSKIFAPTVNVGGVRKPAKKTTSAAPQVSKAYKDAVDSLKGSINNTILNTFSYKSGENIYNFQNAKIKSITKNKKLVAFLVSGTPSVIDQKQALEAFNKTAASEQAVTEVAPEKEVE